MGWYFAFFFLSGFCSILYELVWLRLTMAQFGVTSALVSITLSMFMMGMGAGSWATGLFVRRHSQMAGYRALRIYAVTEFLIGCSSLAVPYELLLGHRWLEAVIGQITWSSTSYYWASGLLVSLTLLPWCFCIGATYPLVMSSIQGDAPSESRRSFSYLYLSNVLGAVAGAIIPLFFIEIYGFHSTLRVGLLANTAIATSAFALSVWKGTRHSDVPPSSRLSPAMKPNVNNGTLALLFLTGLATMGMEVIWIREFAPYVGPFVYAFALVLATYLLATFLGSLMYRDSSRRGDPENPLSWVLLAPMGLLPVLTSDPRLPFGPWWRVCLGVAPFALLIGFLTPMLVDRFSAGDPDRAGRAYAVNVLGCIAGPLLSGFVLLPLVGERVSMLLYAIPWMAMAFIRPRNEQVRVRERLASFAVVVSAIALFLLTKDYVTIFPQCRVLRDSTATVVAEGTGMQKALLTNGVGMTSLSPNTKMMAHLTLASLDQPENALVICFGMGTTYRSAMSWGISTTAVELDPSVPRLFSYYHEDGELILASPRSHLVIDDGRRFLERTSEKFDAIIIDPPPPVQAAASSLLYSDEFYAAAKERLKPDGILQQWLPSGDNAVQASMAKALRDSFPFVKVYGSLEGWGWHFLASLRPIPIRSSSEMVARMPKSAITDMMEWGPASNPTEQIQLVLSKEMTVGQLVSLSPRTPALRDDRPINEYFMLRAREDAK